MNFPIHEKTLKCAKFYKRSEKELIDSLNEMDQSKEYLQMGISSLFQYCIEKLEFSDPETSRFIQVTRKSQKIPALKAAIDTGALTVAKAARITSVITLENQDSWIEKAKTYTHREIEKEVASVKPKELKEEKITAKNDKKCELRVNISYALEEKLRRVQSVLKTRSFEETIEKMTELTLKRKDPVRKAMRNVKRQVIKSEALNQHRTCDVVGRQIGIILRPIPSYIRHEVFLRSHGKCEFKNCGESRYVQIHHIQPFSMGGNHEVNNLMLLCGPHHKMMHERINSQ